LLQELILDSFEEFLLSGLVYIASWLVKRLEGEMGWFIKGKEGGRGKGPIG